MKGDCMLLLLQTQPGFSEIAERMFAEIFAHILELVEPAFPLAFGEYTPIFALTHIITLIGFAMFFGLARNQFGATADLYKSPQPAPIPAESDVEGGAKASSGLAGVALDALSAAFGVLQVAILSYLAISAVVLLARLLVGVG